MHADPILGVFFHWLGGLASASFYIPYRGVRRWAWETYWLAGGLFSWILAPWTLALLLVPGLWGLLREAPAKSLLWAWTFGAMWGLGGLTFGLTMRYLGIALGMAIALGYCAAFGTLMPPLFNGELARIAGETSGRVILLGVAVCLAGIALSGLAGRSKERELTAEQKRAAIREFDFVKGLLVATFSGILSASFAYGLAAGKPLGDAARAALLAQGRSDLWQNLPVLVVVLLGGFTTNFLWCLGLHLKNGTGRQYFARGPGSNPADRVPLPANWLWSALAGTTWYMQFFFYSMGQSRMGKYDFSSWTLHMASIIIFSTLWGIALKEWRGTSRRTHILIGAGLAVLISSTVIVGYGNLLKAEAPPDPLARAFARPPRELHPRPLWFWNGRLDRARTTEIMERCRESGYSGFGILPAHGMNPGFMTPAFLDHYAHALDEAARLGLKMCLYDEYWFPSGAAGGLLAREHPEALSRRLDLVVHETAGPCRMELPLPAGELMAAVAMRSDNLERVDLAGHVRNGALAWEAPPGPWRVMLFACVPDGARGLVDYLDPAAVGSFIELTYGRYYARFPARFGATIDTAFYDEPTMHWVEGGRAWTPRFNEEFRRRHGLEPALLYPALWHDIGPETAAARCALLGCRAELYADGFVGTVARWCRERGLALTGHHDQEEIANPVGLCGDLMRCMRDQEIPGIDQVFKYGRASKVYKVVSSVAFLHDRPLAMCECYGAIEGMPPADLYREAMDQFAKGINLMVPHAVWYDAADVRYPPELSWRTPPYAAELPAWNRYVARLQLLLQGGRHVADIAVLYPIAALQAGYRFGVGKPYEGGVVPPEADYLEVGDALATAVRHDYTFLHPDVLAEKCTIRGPLLRLANRTNAEEYRLIVIPGGRTIHWRSLERIRAFYRSGGAVLATTRLPDTSAEFGRDEDVRAAVAEIFGTAPAGGVVRRSPGGGRACFVPGPAPAALGEAVEMLLETNDVEWEEPPVVAGGSLAYIHKVRDGRDIYFFANSSATQVDAWIRLRGLFLRLERWDPHDGTIGPVETTIPVEGDPATIRVRLVLPPARSIFLVERGNQPGST